MGLRNTFGAIAVAASLAVAPVTSAQAGVNLVQICQQSTITTEQKQVRTQDGLDIYYWVTRVPGAEKFCVLHPGLFVNHTALGRLEEELNKRGYSTIAIDRRGTGLSSKPSEPEYYHINDYSRDLELILNTEGIEKPILIGHCQGFMVIADYVARTGNAEMLVGIGVSQNYKKTISPWIVDIFTGFNKMTSILGTGIATLYHEISGKPWEYEDYTVFDGKSDIELWFELKDQPYNQMLADFVCTGNSHWDITQQLHMVDEEVVLITGEYDEFVSPQNSRKVCNLVSGQCYFEEIDNEGHGLPITDPMKVMEVLEKYL